MITRGARGVRVELRNAREMGENNVEVAGCAHLAVGRVDQLVPLQPQIGHNNGFQTPNQDPTSLARHYVEAIKRRVWGRT